MATIEELPVTSPPILRVRQNSMALAASRPRVELSLPEDGEHESSAAKVNLPCARCSALLT